MSGNTSATGGYLTPTSPLPEDDDVLASILHDFVVGLTGLVGSLVRPRWQPQPPTQPDASVTWAAVGAVNVDTTSQWPDFNHTDGVSTQVEQQTIEVIATFYGPRSGSFASLFRSGLNVRQNLDVIGTFGIKLLSIGATTRVPELINTQYIARSDVTFRLVRELSRTYDIENVATAPVTYITDATTPAFTSSVVLTIEQIT